jgi:hypothetical protein
MEEVWKVTYTGAKLVGKFLEGLLKVCLKKHWVVLLNSDGSPLEGRKIEAKEKIHQGLVLNFASFMVCVNCPAEPPLARSPSCDSLPLRWKVSCSPFGLHPGFPPQAAILLLRPQDKRLILLNLDEVIIEARYLLENEEVLPGHPGDDWWHGVDDVNDRLVGNPKRRCDENNSKFSLSKKPRFINPVGKSQTPEGDAC